MEDKDMIENTYARFTEEELILRDYLAADRTTLANETTFLAYVRTSFTLFLAGLSVLQFFRTPIMLFFSWVCLLGGILIFLFVLIRYRRMNNRIHQIKSKTHEVIKNYEDTIKKSELTDSLIGLTVSFVKHLFKK